MLRMLQLDNIENKLKKQSVVMKKIVEELENENKLLHEKIKRLDRLIGLYRAYFDFLFF